MRIFAPEFVGKLAVLIEESNLKKKIYRDIVSFYRLQGKKPEELIPEGRALYQALAQKIEIKDNENIVKNVAPVAAMVGVVSGLRPLAHMYDQVAMVILLIAFVAIGIWIYVKCRENHSHVFSQVMTIIYGNIALFVIYVGDIWTPVLESEEAMLSLESSVILASCGWLIVLFIFTVVSKICSKLRKK